ncbi:hypothetical protein H5410_061656 [Solanum commersonii]|uniref:Uncharacterized protein n=1 Tax=Solanum commersonii TaxID=4109 RepID=A0A9J5W8M4_SOLCO|nr:hypothetical protein H5410_061656 [Solanum commersonii]
MLDQTSISDSHGAANMAGPLDNAGHVQLPTGDFAKVSDIGDCHIGGGTISEEQMSTTTNIFAYDDLALAHSTVPDIHMSIPPVINNTSPSAPVQNSLVVTSTKPPSVSLRKSVKSIKPYGIRIM